MIKTPFTQMLKKIYPTTVLIALDCIWNPNYQKSTFVLRGLNNPLRIIRLEGLWIIMWALTESLEFVFVMKYKNIYFLNYDNRLFIMAFCDTVALSMWCNIFQLSSASFTGCESVDVLILLPESLGLLMLFIGRLLSDCICSI